MFTEDGVREVFIEKERFAADMVFLFVASFIDKSNTVRASFELDQTHVHCTDMVKNCAWTIEKCSEQRGSSKC